MESTGLTRQHRRHRRSSHSPQDHRPQPEAAKPEKSHSRKEGWHHHRMKPEIDSVLQAVFKKIGKPGQAEFVPDAFQLEAIEAVQGSDCLVTAPTGSGKTWIAEQAIMAVFKRGGRCWYASPLKALSNSKWVEFSNCFDGINVGIVTGDTKENTNAPIIVGTTEILRNQLYDMMHRGEDFPCDLVVIDEAHYLGDADRGVVWEEIMIYLPSRVNLLLLSATIGNDEELAGWLSGLRGKPCVVIKERKRPVPLYPLFLHPSGRVMPYTENKKLFHGLISYQEQAERERRLRYMAPRMDEIIHVLEHFNLIPAIFFLKSRAECDACSGSLPSSAAILFGSGFRSGPGGIAGTLPLSAQSPPFILSSALPRWCPSWRTAPVLEIPCGNHDEQGASPGNFCHLHRRRRGKLSRPDHCAIQFRPLQRL